MSFCVEPGVVVPPGPSVVFVKPAGFELGARLSGIAAGAVAAASATIPPAATAAVAAAAVDGPCPQTWPLRQNAVVCGVFGTVLLPPGFTNVTRHVLVPAAGTVSEKAPPALAVVETTLPGTAPE